MKQTRFVIDACALIALVNQEEGQERVLGLLKNAENGNVNLYMHAVNLCEVYYDSFRSSGAKAAEALLKTIYDMPLEVVETIDTSLLKEAGRIKASEKLSLADSFAAALANKMKAQLVTADHHEFDPIVEKGVVKVYWVR